MNIEPLSLLKLLQLVSVPVGAYSYSEGLERLVEDGRIKSEVSLKIWLADSLKYGTIRVETAVMLRAFNATKLGDLATLNYWNGWATATRETEELRQQSWQMGRTLLRLLQATPAGQAVNFLLDGCEHECNFAVAFGMTAACWQMDTETAAIGYLYSWIANLVSAGVKLIPLGQTAGQQLLLELHAPLSLAAQDVLGLKDDDLCSCSWGLALASMAHETQYTRLFRS